MTTIRAFFAIDLPLEIQNILSDFINQLKIQHPHESIRWSKPQHLHITLQFLPALKLDDIATLASLVKEEIKQTKPFEVALGNLELFPNVHHPRVISMQVEPQEKLAELSQQVGKKIMMTGYHVEKRPFRGHLTLSRIHQPIQLSDFVLPDIPAFCVREITLYQSSPDPSGSRYIPLDHFIFS